MNTAITLSMSTKQQCLFLILSSELKLDYHNLEAPTVIVYAVECHVARYKYIEDYTCTVMKTLTITALACLRAH